MAVGTEPDQERNESATPYRLAEARKRGQVAKSPEVVTALVIATAAAVVIVHGWAKAGELLRLSRATLNGLSFGVPQDQLLLDMAVRSVWTGLSILMAPMVVLMVVGALGNIVQTGPVWSGVPLGPDWQRLNPAQGWRRLISIRTAFETLRNLLKLSVIGGVAFMALVALVPGLAPLSTLPPTGQLWVLVREMGSFALKLAAALAVIAVIDWLYTRREFAKNMRMSRRDIRDELKHREGDPRIRSRMREIRREWLKRARSVLRTSEADLVVVNPTHLAVALRYRHGEMPAPVVLCSGVGVLAAAMRAIAARHGVPIFRSPALARAIHAKTAVNNYVPAELYPDVARLMIWVISMKSARSASWRASAP